MKDDPTPPACSASAPTRRASVAGSTAGNIPAARSASPDARANPGEVEAVIRSAQREDLPAIVSLWRDLQEHNAAHDPRLTPSAGAADWFLDFLRDEMGSVGAALFVAEADGVVVGYVFGQILRRPTLHSGDCGYVADLFVLDRWRVQGVGRRLFHALRDWFRARGLTAIELQIVRANPASQAFWRKMGFSDFLRTLRSDG